MGPMRLLDLLLPPACACCGRSGALLCPACVGRFRAPSDIRDRFVAPDAGVVVGDALLMAVAAFAYEGPMRRALWALKYSGASRLAPPLANASLPALRALLPVAGPEPVLVPVPVHAERQAARGYNQAELIGRQLSRSFALPLFAILERTRPTTKQHRLNRVARLNNLLGAFAVVSRPPPTVILVDDIITTTATLEACASVLLDAGCAAVYGLAVAREV